MDVGRAHASAITDKNDNLWITGGQVKSLIFSMKDTDCYFFSPNASSCGRAESSSPPASNGLF